MIQNKLVLTNLIVGRKMILFLVVIFFSCNRDAYQDVSFYSDAFETDRMYRIYLPESYDENADVRYPVVYYFHGYGGRYKWDGYDVEDDINYPENGRKEPPFVMEWKNYVKNNDVIIVTWDGYEPNLHKGKKFREGIPYGNTSPYDYMRAHDTEDHHWGWDYRQQFRELVKHVDENFRTIADRNNRAITGLSMGGQTAYYIAGQNKDLVSSVSAFDPADVVAMYGPKGKQVAFPVLEFYRPLKGLSVRLTMTDGDWLKYNDWKMHRFFQAADLDYYEFHVADYPNHWTADADKQLDFHMKEFEKPHQLPDNWHHVDPAFPSFNVLGYDVNVQRPQPALTIMEDVSKDHLKILSRTFIPDGPILQDEKISISTRNIYTPNAPYQLISYNLTSEEFDARAVKATPDGKLNIQLEGGGHIVGINGEGSGNGIKLRIVPNNNREYFYFEVGKQHDLNFKLINVGNEDASDIKITASSNHPYINIEGDEVQVSSLKSTSYSDLKNQFDFNFTEYNDSSFVGSIIFDIEANGTAVTQQSLMFFTVPNSPHIEDQDILILDGRVVEDVPVYRQGPNEIQQQEISGGKGNGNGILEPGEDALVYVKLPKGMGPNDINTFHKTYLVNHLDDPYISVDKLNYQEKLSQAGATSVSSVLSISDNVPDGHILDALFRIESLYNDKEDTTSNATIYANRYDYRRAKIKIGR